MSDSELPTEAPLDAGAEVGPIRSVFAYLIATVWMPLKMVAVAVSFWLAMSWTDPVPIIVVSTLLWLVGPALVVVFAMLDRRTLLASGVVAPFGWAWTFIGVVANVAGPGIYLIGRAVKLRRVGIRSQGPLNAWIVLAVLILMAEAVVLFLAIELEVALANGTLFAD